MTAQNNIEVVIGGKTYKLAGGESPDYIRAVASYVDAKLTEMTDEVGSALASKPDFAVLLALNIADELYNKNGADTVAAASKALNDNIAAQNKQLENMQSIIAEKDNQIKALEESLAKSTDTVNNHENTINELEKKIVESKRQLTTSQHRMEEKSKYISTLIAKIDNKNQELNGLSNKLAEKNTALNELNKKSAERNIKLNTVNKERDELAIKLKAANSTIRTDNETIIRLNKEHNEAVKAIESACSEKVAAVTEQLNSANNQLNDVNAQLDRLNQDYKTLRSEFENYQTGELDGQLQSAFAKVKADNIDLRREIDSLRAKVNKR